MVGWVVWKAETKVEVGVHLGNILLTYPMFSQGFKNEIFLLAGKFHWVLGGERLKEI